MNKQKIRLYLNFHRSTLALNWLVSIAVSSFSFSFRNLALATLTAGFLVSLLYKEIRQRDEYYFYYNAGISKLNLILGSFLLNLISAELILFISEL